MEGIGKKAQQLKMGGIIFLIVVGILIFKPDILTGFFGQKQAIPDQQTKTNVGTPPSLGTVEVVGKCGQAVTLTTKMVERYTEGVGMGSRNASIFINGKEVGTRSDGGTLTVAEGDQIDIYYDVDFAPPGSRTYYASKASGVIPNCKPAVLSSEPIFTPIDAYKVYRASTLPTASLVNLEDYTSNPGTALSLGAGAQKVERVTITWPFNEGYGTVDGSTLACRFTDAQIDQDKVTATLDGVRLGNAKYVPSTTVFATTAVNQSTKFWQFPAIDGAVKSTSTLDILIAGDSTNEPVAATNFSCQLKDTDYFKTNSGVYNIGVEDSDDQTDIGRNATLGSSAGELMFNVQLS